MEEGVGKRNTEFLAVLWPLVLVMGVGSGQPDIFRWSPAAPDLLGLHLVPSPVALAPPGSAQVPSCFLNVDVTGECHTRARRA